MVLQCLGSLVTWVRLKYTLVFLVFYFSFKDLMSFQGNDLSSLQSAPCFAVGRSTATFAPQHETTNFGDIVAAWRLHGKKQTNYVIPCQKILLSSPDPFCTFHLINPKACFSEYQQVQSASNCASTTCHRECYYCMWGGLSKFNAVSTDKSTTPSCRASNTGAHIDMSCDCSHHLCKYVPGNLDIASHLAQASAR